MSTSPYSQSSEWKPKVIIFDLLTALLDSWTLWDASTPTGTAEEGRKWRKRYLELTFGAGVYVPYADLVQESARQVNLPDSAAANLLRDWESIQPWPEAGAVLQGLKALGYRLGVVTNCSKTLGHVAAARAGSEGVFDVVVTAEESEFYKPAKEAYRAALVAMGVGVEDALFVAGSAGDVEGATEVGMKVVWHNRVGLDRKGEAVPLREGGRLDDALRGFL
ncbi:putative 2-deoxyglucose-6-phosphate phosphatase [Massarina eburnea CBS 473.64]|uniref:Putative 2-deoxyglucose-6-phosphate phosphatase n=1 Tax=Massarina eburnea CBS 473.64 TaxID=1395130 RepID=A0A6A6RQV3_9PLEO|nr:putative 2-deoxyglucose-6-phosphate phosphatase [Massarina eburnea CBS 473.64]